jgi:putative ABC transport system permease protein
MLVESLLLAGAAALAGVALAWLSVRLLLTLRPANLPRLDRVEGLPGVTAVTAANPLPLDGREGLVRWGTEEARADPTKFQQATSHFVLPGYFEAMNTRVIEGRTFTDTDNIQTAGAIVVDRILAMKAFPGQSAVGRTLLVRARTQEPERFQIIGVVDHQRHVSPAADGREGIFIPDGYMNFAVANRWAVRTSGDPAALGPSVRAAVAAINPRAGVIEVQPMSAFIEQARAQTTFALVLIGIFAFVALVLAAVGLYSVLSAVVRQRTAEIGVRMAFGAEHRTIFRMMVGEGMWLSGVGITAGLRQRSCSLVSCGRCSSASSQPIPRRISS